MDDSDFEELCGVADFDGVEDDAGEPETAAAVAAPPASKPTPAVATRASASAPAAAPPTPTAPVPRARRNADVTHAEHSRRRLRFTGIGV